MRFSLYCWFCPLAFVKSYFKKKEPSVVRVRNSRWTFAIILILEQQPEKWNKNNNNNTKIKKEKDKRGESGYSSTWKKKKKETRAGTSPVPNSGFLFIYIRSFLETTTTQSGDTERDETEEEEVFLCFLLRGKKKKRVRRDFFLKIPLTFLYVFLISFWGWAHAHTVQFTSLCVREAQSINISVTNNSLFFFPIARAHKTVRDLIIPLPKHTQRTTLVIFPVVFFSVCLRQWTRNKNFTKKKKGKKERKE